MSRIFKICPSCNETPIKRRDAKRCIKCHLALRKTTKPYNYKGACVCECGNKKAWHANKCRKCVTVGLPDCKICGGKLSVYKNSNQYNTGICQKCYKGELTKRWNGNLTNDERGLFRTKQPMYYEWRKRVFDRDKYTCQKCSDNSGGNLCSHHIENFSENKEKRFDVNNGITLCVDCHKSFHKKYGWKGNNLIQMSEYLKLGNHSK